MSHALVRMTAAEWNVEGTRRFGPDQMKWKFVCPVCGHVASIEDWKKVGASIREAAFSCIGRHIEGSRPAFEKEGKGPCTYAGGGLFRLNPVEVVDGKKVHQMFAFAEPSA